MTPFRIPYTGQEQGNLGCSPALAAQAQSSSCSCWKIWAMEPHLGSFLRGRALDAAPWLADYNTGAAAGPQAHTTPLIKLQQLFVLTGL